MSESESRVRGDVQHGEGGKFVDKYDDDDVLQALIEAHPEPLTNQEVADRIDCSKTTAHNRLHELENDDQIRTKKPGANARVWWVESEVAGSAEGNS